ncbi:hypothetical protein ACHAXS_001330 [Conticribra weissflogii]
MEIVTRMTYIAAGNIATWFSWDGTPGSSGCISNSGYHAYLAADDDDGNLNNGTPHMTAIYSAFNSHQIACPTSYTPRQDFGCSNKPVTPPVVSITNSNTAATLTWQSVPNAVKYQVFRSEGVHQCAQGKVLLGETSGSLRTWTDTGLQNGRKYYYVIIPKGEADSCFGPSSDCITASPSEVPFSIICPNTQVTIDLESVPTQNSQTCTISAIGGWTGTIDFYCTTSSGLSGVSCEDPASITISASSTPVILTISASTSAISAEGSVTLTATDRSGFSASFTAYLSFITVSPTLAPTKSFEPSQRSPPSFSPSVKPTSSPTKKPTPSPVITCALKGGYCTMNSNCCNNKCDITKKKCR